MAQSTGTEIISCDSRQFFRSIPIGTAHPSKEELQAVPHHFIGILDIDEYYSAGKFENDALQKIEALHKEKKAVVFTGGSGLYVDAVLKGLDDVPPKDETLRETLNDAFEKEGISYLQEQLKNLDAEYFEKVDQQNPRRLIRGLEVVMTTGKSILSFQNKAARFRPFEIIKIGLQRDRAELYERINRRVDIMLESGLLEEAKKVFPLKEYNALQTVGYTELFDYFEGKHNLEEAVRLIKRNSRRYAKRQLTWLRKQEDVNWFHPEKIEEITTFTQNKLNKSG